VSAARSRLVVVSNRLPVSVTRSPGGRLVARPSDGGLVSALGPALRDRGGTWVGWSGGPSGAEARTALRRVARTAGYDLRAVSLSADEQRGFYLGFANEVIWPLFHDLGSACRFVPDYWQAYLSANSRYAEQVAAVAGPRDLVWVHDYHLIHLREELRARGCGARAAFFLHIPFPSPDMFLKLPWRRPLLEALLAYDLVGFQTPRDRRNFLDCVGQLLPGVSLTGRGGPVVVAGMGPSETRIGRFPIGIDYNDFVRRSLAPEVTAAVERLRSGLPGRQLLLGIDRLDYTKGIPERLQAFALALEQHPELHERVTLIQVVVPSREGIGQYQALKEQVENLVGQINGRFTRPGGWVPIHYAFRRLTPVELLAYYRAASVALVTPLKDGMNLVAKEFCACQAGEDGVLVLSEFAGAAAELRPGALLVNPYDVAELAGAIATALAMEPAERRRRMRRLRRTVRRHDVFWWTDTLLRAASGRDGEAFPEPSDHVHLA
jgi:trehalose 6-phosphate synthase